MVYSKRWYGIKGQTVGAATRYATEVIRVQTEKDGPWQSLNDKEIEQLMIDHNKMIEIKSFHPPPKQPTTKVIEKASAKKARKKAKKK